MVNKPITKKDIKETLKDHPTKKDIAILMSGYVKREDVKSLSDEMKKQHGEVMDVLDDIAKSIKNLREEYFAMMARLDRHEKWIKIIAEKVGVNLKNVS